MTTPHTKRSRLRRIAKWTGLITCVLIVVAWGVSLGAWMWYDGGTWACDCSRGVVSFNFSPDNEGTGWGGTELGWGLEHAEDLHWISYRSGRDRDGPWTIVTVPLWLPLLVLAIPTAILWHRDRRHYPPGHCRQCGYDLTGNESGVCSECGELCGLARSER